MPGVSTRLYDDAPAPRIVPRREFRTVEDEDAPARRDPLLNPDTGNFQYPRHATFCLKNYVLIFFASNNKHSLFLFLRKNGSLFRSAVGNSIRYTKTIPKPKRASVGGLSGVFSQNGENLSKTL